MELVLPSSKYIPSYNAYIEELGDEVRYPFPMGFDHQDFDALLAKLSDFALGNNLPDGFVPSTTLWLVEGDKLVGVTNLRHYLNSAIEECGGHIGLGIRPSYRGKGLGKLLMKLSVEKLNAMGISCVHVHCYKDNYASASTIIANGGELHSELTLDGKVVQRYFINSVL
ncbi:MAG: GNAT family N-acetyltransferase [Marinomonas sp.]|uniref:GNAT family N-acetyltransferase n=1 Tax=Marinomonas sp. TaxID=1904862 RepID=UPI003F976809